MLSIWESEWQRERPKRGERDRKRERHTERFSIIYSPDELNSWSWAKLKPVGSTFFLVSDRLPDSLARSWIWCRTTSAWTGILNQGSSIISGSLSHCTTTPAPWLTHCLRFHTHLGSCYHNGNLDHGCFFNCIFFHYTFYFTATKALCSHYSTIWNLNISIAFTTNYNGLITGKCLSADNHMKSKARCSFSFLERC